MDEEDKAHDANDRRKNDEHDTRREKRTLELWMKVTGTKEIYL